MIGLKSFRYIIVWAQKIKAINLVFNPQFVHDWEEASAFWIHAQKFKGNKQKFLEIFDHLSKKINFSHRTGIDFDCAFVSKLPTKEILSETEYNHFLKDKTPLLVERFSHPDSFNHLGSSRHLLLGNIQVKGAGRNNLVSRTDYIHAWGGMFEIEAYYSYLASNYLDRQLPLGACPTFKIDRFNNDHFQILRSARGLRISQFSPHMNHEELKVFQSAIGDETFLHKMAFQFAYASFCNIYNYSMIAENMLIDGRVIDCESIYNAKSLEYFNFSLDICLKGPEGLKIKKEDLKNWGLLAKHFRGQQNSWLCNSSVHGPRFIFKKIEDIHRKLFPSSKISKDGSHLYWNYLQKMMKLQHGGTLSSSLISFLEGFSKLPCELGSTESLNLSFDWANVLNPIKEFLDPIKPFEVFFMSQEKHQTFLRVRFNILRPHTKHQLLNHYNIKPRIDMLQEASIFLHSKIKKKSIENASSLNHVINRLLVVAPFQLDQNNNVVWSPVKRSGLTLWIKSKLPNQKESELLFSWARLNHNDELIEEQGNFKLLPKHGEFILFEIQNKKNGFKYLTSSILVV
jgi:hypothetical protein